MKKLLLSCFYVNLILFSYFAHAQVEERLGWNDPVPVFFSEFHYDDGNTPQDLEFLEVTTIAGYSLDGWSIEVITEILVLEPEPFIWQSLPLSGFGTLDETGSVLVTHFVDVPWVDYIGYTFGGIPNRPAAVLLRDPDGEIKDFISAGGTITFENIKSHEIRHQSGNFVTENNSTPVDRSIQNNGFNEWTANVPSSPNVINLSHSDSGFAGSQNPLNQAYEVTWTGVNDFWNTPNWAVFTGNTNQIGGYGYGFYQESTLNIPSGSVTLNTDSSSLNCHGFSIPQYVNPNSCGYQTLVKHINLSGTFFIDIAGSLEVNEAIANTGNLEIDGTLFGSLDIINSGTFTMNSEQISATNLENTQTLNIGNTYGSTFTGNISTSGTMNFEIEGNTPRLANTGYQQLSVDGDISLGGTLNVSINESYEPANGTSHSIITYTGNLTGTFADVILPPLYRIDYSTSGQINIIRDSATLSTNTTDIETLLIYPNPTAHTLNIELRNNDLEKVEIFNLRGQSVFTSTSKTINIAQLPSGMYLARITSQQGEMAVKKIFKN